MPELLDDAGGFRALLHRIVGSDVFSRSPQARRFLEYVTEKALAGQVEDLKAYTIGVAALGVVGERSCPETAARMQASRLRRLLSRYYETAGKEDAYELQLPAGAYVPVFVARREKVGRGSYPPLAPDAGPNPGWPSVRVDAFEGSAEGGREALLARALGESIVSALVAGDGLRVSQARTAPGPHVSFVLHGSLMRLDGTWRISAALRRIEDDEAVWSERFDLADGTDLRLGLDRVAESIAAQVGDPVSGAVSLACRDRRDYGAVYSALQELWRFLRHPTVAGHAQAKIALERAMPLEEGRSRVHAAYALVLGLAPFLEGSRSDALSGAEVHARAALAEDEAMPFALLARAVVAYQERDYGAAERLAEEAADASGRGSFVRAFAGNLVALVGRPERGRALIEEAFGLQPRLPRHLQSAICLDLLLRKGDPQAGLQIAQRIGRETPVWGNLLEASSWIMLGQAGEARRAAARVDSQLGMSPKQLERRLALSLPLASAEPLLGALAEVGLVPAKEARPQKQIAPARTRNLPHELRVGVLHSLSGPMAMCETHLVNAAMLAIEEINLQGGVLGRPVRALVEDGASSPETFRAKADKLLQEHGVKHIFGCWMSSSRKAILPALEANRALLWYPLQYEGLECSQNVVYAGSSLNQQVEPAVRWADERGFRRCLLVGSDYVYPRTANRLIRGLLESSGGTVDGEFYVPLGRAESFSTIADLISERKPDIVFSTINGADNLAFFKALERRGVDSEQTPVMSFSLSEIELQNMHVRAQGHYACWSYFQSIESAENAAMVRRYRGRYGEASVLSDPIVTAYAQVHLWKDAVQAAGTLDLDPIWSALVGAEMDLGGERLRVRPNHHIDRRALIGKARADGQFDLVWCSPGVIAPEPWLGVDQANILSRNLVLEALRALPEMAERASHPESRLAQGWS